MKISKILLLCAVLSFFAWGTAFAEIKATINLPTVNANPGEQIQVPITVSTNEAIGIAQFVVDYNKDVITYASASLGSDVPGFSVSNVNPNLPFSPGTPGTNENVLVQVSGGGSNSFTGNDKQVVVLRFNVVGAGGTSSPLAFDQNGSRTYLSTIGLYDIKGSELAFNNGSANVISTNTPPTASNVSLTPASPKTADNLVGSYTYGDAESDPESGTEIRWYKNSVLQSAYNDQLTVPSSATAKGEQWYFTVKPKDGKDFGTLVQSNTVTIGNTAPVASSLAITPASPKTGDDLVGSYSYNDADGDAQSASEIRWYKNTVLQSAYNDQLTVPSSATAKGEQWYFTVKPKDGTDFGTLQTSAAVTIGNTAPVASSLAITPASPLDTDNLVGSYSYSDADADANSGSEIRWYKNSVVQTAYNDVLTVPASATAAGEQWYFTVKPKDGTDFGALQTSATVTIGAVNTPPTASNVSLTPASPKTGDNLVGSYTYNDADSDPESGTEIRWYKNGALQSTYNNLLTVPSSATAKGEQWYFTVKPRDGKDFGALVQSNTVTVGNTAPVASNLAITPASPLDTDNLVGSYSYSDADADAQSGSEIRWYKNGAVQAAYNDVLTVPASATAAGEQWYFTVKPKDGTDFGTLQTSATVTIGAVNTPPTASNVSLTPASPKTGDNLVGSYTYNDADSDPESGTEIRWYKNGALQSAYNNLLTVPSSATAKGEQWYFTVKPKDGKDFGTLVQSNTVTIGNTAPVASNLAITPASPKTGDNLVGSYTYSDADNDPQSGSEIRWYKNGSLQSAYNEQLTVPSSATAKGEQWYFTAKPKDGTDFGTLQTSGTVTIGNTAPVASNLAITPTSPLDTDNLVGSYSYSDADADVQSGSEIRWYKNGSVQAAYNDVLTVPASATTAGEQWYFTVKPKDGTDFGTLQTSATVTIGAVNAPPTASNVSLTPASPKTGDNLVGSYTYNDADSDPESGSEIRWYKNGALQSAYNNLLTVPSSATAKGEQWYFTVKPKDGKDFGTLVQSNTVTIGNTAPAASNLAITPSNPLDADNLVGSYSYSDADSDPQSGSEIRWYKNGAVQSTYNDVLTVPASATTVGDQWYFTVKPKDGTDFGALQTSPTVTVSNTFTLTVNIDPAGSGSVSKNPDKASYNQGEQVTLTASPNAGYTFDHWSGDASGTNRTVTITMDANKTVTAHFKAITYVLTITVDPPQGGTVAINPDKPNYTYGEQVTLTATPNAEYEFDHWSGAASGTNPVVSITMNSDKEVTAHFRLKTYTLTVTIAPTGTGTVAKNPNKTQYNHGEQVTLTATPNSGYEFSHWSGDASGTNPTVTITMNANKNVTANFKAIATYSLIINIDPAGSGSVTKNPDKAYYQQGEQVTLTAVPNTGYVFDHWSGDATGTNSTVTLTMNANKTVTAHFKLKTYTLTVTVAPAGSGTVAKNPDKANYNHGEQVTLTATPNTGYEFVNWSGDATGTNPTVTITMNSNKNVTANFKVKTYTLTVTIDPAGSGTVAKNPDKANYNHGEQVTLTATPNTGYEFDRWSGDATGTNPAVTITMNGNKNVTAHFKAKTYTLTVTVNPPEGGTVTKNPDKANYTHGEQVTLTATPNSGYRFVNWSGDASGTNSTVTITMTSNKQVTANFAVVVQEKKMHVKSIIVTKEKFIKFVRGKAEVLIVDANGAPVDAATVIGQWSRGANDRDTLVTKNDGRGETFSNWTVANRRFVQEFTFKIIDVKKDGWIYDSAANEMNYGSTDGQLGDLLVENSHNPEFENLSDGKYAWNSPNPFNPKTTISFFLPEAAQVKVEIYNILGKKIATLLDGHAAAGINSVDWSARDDNGFDVTSGTYFYRISVENEEPIIQKILLLK